MSFLNNRKQLREINKLNYKRLYTYKNMYNTIYLRNINHSIFRIRKIENHYNTFTDIIL